MLQKYSFTHKGNGEYRIDTQPYDGDYDFTYKEINLFNPYNPLEDIRRIVESIDHNYHNNYIIFGIRNTILIEEILKRMSDFSTLTIIEFDHYHEDFHLIGTERFSQVFNSNKIEFLYKPFGELGEVLAKVFRYTLFNSNLKNTKFIVNPYMRTLYDEDVRKIMTVIFEGLYSQISGYGNAVEDMLWGTDNLFNNWDIYVKGKNVKEFRDIYKGVPAIIVGAGPSLEADIETIKRIKGKVLILGVDAALRELKKQGITPDAVTTIERTDEPEFFYNGIDGLEKEVFLGPNVIVKSILNKYNKWIFSGRSGDGVFLELNKALDNENLDVGLTVANVMFAYAQLFGCDPIIYSGVDLAYVGGKTHTSDVLDNITDDLKACYTDNVSKVKGVDGDMLDTFEFFVYTKVWLETKMAKFPSTRYINCTRGGAYMQGAKHMHIEEVEKLLEGYPEIEQRLWDKYAAIEKVDGADLSTTSKGLDFLNELNDEFDEFVQMIEECQENVGDSEKGKLDEIVENRVRIDSYYASHNALRFFLQPEFIRYSRELHSFPIILTHENEVAVHNVSTSYYKLLIDIVGKIKESLKVYIEVLEKYYGMFGGNDGR